MLSTVLLNRDLPNKLKIMERSDRATTRWTAWCCTRTARASRTRWARYDLKDALAREHGVKVVMIEADHADPRAYSAEQSETRLQAFMESF